MNARNLTRLAAAICLAAGAASGRAAEITTIQPSADNVVLRGGPAVVRFNVGGTADGRDRCGYFVEYGDGAARDSRVIEGENGPFNRPHERSFGKPGTYTIRASGRNVKTTGACNGSATTSVTVTAGASGPSRRSGAEPTCPAGWTLKEGSVNWRTGAFSCLPSTTAALECGDGLVYYAQDGMIGCRQARRRDQERDR